MRYFSIMVGLRGCYMPDSVYSVAVKTRRELKALLMDERDNAADHDRSIEEIRADGEYFASAREVASVAAALWRRAADDRDAHLSDVIPFGPEGSSGIQVNPISRAEYLASREESEEC